MRIGRRTTSRHAARGTRGGACGDHPAPVHPGRRIHAGNEQAGARAGAARVTYAPGRTLPSVDAPGRPEVVICLTAAYPASVSRLKVVSPRLAHSIILLAINLRARCFSLPVGRSRHARSRATSMLAMVRSLKRSAIIATFLSLPGSEKIITQRLFLSVRFPTLGKR